MDIGFIGAGKVGCALGLYFKHHGLNVSGYYSRTRHSASEAAIRTGSQEFDSIAALAGSCDVIFFTVPDQAFEELDRKISAQIDARRIGNEKIWLHVSGAHPSDILAGIRAAGCAVGSMHPLESFGEPVSSAARLDKAWFTVEGAEEAANVAETILKHTGGKYRRIKAGDKALYHAGACVVSNYLVTLLESGIKLFEAAGFERKDIFDAIEPLIHATLSNVRGKGTVEAMTGPIVRADFNTVGVHLRAIQTAQPKELDIYRVMAQKTAEMLRDKRLTVGQTEELQLMLEETKHVR